jgi:hypothetical protein
MLYSQGFKDGAGFLAHRHQNEPDYDRGYADGQAARNKAVNTFCDEIGFKPSILRAD